MESSPENRESCHACGVRMDVSGLAPFTMVECPKCGVQTRVKSRFGPYRLVRRHAIGGMSMVFAAQDETLAREVALKILSEDYSADERRIAAFEQEARLTASFSHPNVVRVFTTGRAFGRFYIAMEMVPGGHLEQRIHDLGKIPETEMLPLAIEVARGLKAAKAAGLIHRDVKPGNILLDAEGHAKLVDFGLALVTHGGKVRASELWATPYYVPPETVDGGDEDFRSDIYAFGATLFHTLSGKPPCGEESMSTDALREAKKHVPPLEKTAPSISLDTCRIVNKAMAYYAADRHGSYDELIADLTNALARLKNGGADASGSRKRLRSRLRNKHALLPVAALVIAVLGTSAWYAWTLTQRARQDPVIMQGPPTAPPTAAMDEVDHSVEITRGFREARAALEAGDYETAGREFMALYKNPNVHEPTRTWAAVEAVLAAFLDGRSADAREAAAAAVEHVRALPPEHPLSGGAWLELLQGIGSFKPLASPAKDESVSSMVAAMLAGLKNWEQGMPDAAADCFRKVVAAKLPKEAQWAGFYQKAAADYLVDHEMLKSAPFIEEPVNAAACGQSIAKLEDALATLKTRGRARFNLRARQLDLKHRSQRLEAQEALSAADPPPVAAPALDEVMARLAGLAAERRFAEAAAYLEELPDDPPGARRESLVAMAGAARVFLTDIGQDLAGEKFSGELPLKDGRTLTVLEAVDAGMLRATLDGGGAIACGWSDFTADALISLYRLLVKRQASEIERLRRHESAIAFDWLAGDRQRALAAASNLAQSSPEFRKRWDEIASGLPE